MPNKYPSYPYPLSDLIDRMSICQLKSIYIYEHKKEYANEIINIKKDIDYLLKNKDIKFTADMIHAAMLIILSNYCIWLNESKAREGSKDQDNLLKFTHSVNGQRNTAKNFISHEIKDRIDLKIDCLAAEFRAEDFIKQNGDWQLF